MYPIYCCLVTLVIGALFQDLHADPCSFHTVLSGQYKRSTGYTLQDTDIAISDNFLPEGWYRFDSGAGNDMATHAPAIKKCGTLFPIWLSGPLPSDADGEVSRTACIVGFSGPCYRTINIRIKSCGEYRVYYMLPAPQTSTAYCIGNETLCPLGQTSHTGFTPCQALFGRISIPIYTNYLPPISTNPAVNVSLEIKQGSTNSDYEAVEPVFKCLFDEPVGSQFWYDTYWYINTDIVKMVESQLYQSNQSWLYPKDWVDNYDLNMVVKCSVRVRHFEEGIPGHHIYSQDFPAGMFPSSFSYRVKEGETVSINFTVTVPLGCYDSNDKQHCVNDIYVFTPVYQSSIGSCQNFSSQGGISFQKEKCGIVIKSSTWWEEKSLKVIGKTDGLINMGERDVYVKLVSKTESTADPSGVWHNFTMPDIKIFLFDQDKKIANKVCSARTDPRMLTFDGKYWTSSLSGEFVMYRDNRRKIAVHALFSSCNTDFLLPSWFPPCICGIAVRVENSLYVYRTCGEISNHYSKPIIHHHNVYQICDDRHMTVEIGDPITKITLPNGAIVTYGRNLYWVYMIQVTPSIFDEDNVEGLCGNPNDNMADDFTIQGSSSIVENAREFQASWRVVFQSTESLFGTNTTLDSTDSELQKYCECAATEKQSEFYSIADHYTANCSIATETVLCSKGTTVQSLRNTCDRHQNRYKREANDMDFEHHIKTRSLDSDDTIEPQPLIIDPNFDPNFIPPTSSWKNGWTEPEALEHCESIILNNPARIECEKYIPMENHTKVAMEDCVLDIKDSGSAEFSTYTMESVKEYCFEQIKKYEIFHTKNDSEFFSVVERIGKIVCPNDCSYNGVCNEGTCTCNSSYVGVDCSHAKTIPPSNLTLPDGGLCKNTKRPCKETNIFGYFQSETVFVKFERFEIKKTGTTKILSTTVLQPAFMSLTILKISIPNSRSKRSPSEDSYGMGFDISLSYDGIHFSESLTLVIYNDACYNCSATPPECSTTSTCMESSTTTKVNTVTQSSTVGAKNDNFPGGSNFVPSEKQDEANSPLLIVIVVICAVILVLIVVFIIVHHVKLKPTAKLSPLKSFVDLHMTQSEFWVPPVKHNETNDCDRNQSPPPRYDLVYDNFKATGESRPC